jgi:glyoxalase superfamily protein
MSAVLFARDQKMVAEFYSKVGAVPIRVADQHHSVLQIDGFDFVVHQIPSHLLPPLTPGEPLRRREQSAVRLDFPVRDLAAARRAAAQSGGAVDEQPPPWAGGDTSFFLGQDPEGNVFGLKVRA